MARNIIHRLGIKMSSSYELVVAGPGLSRVTDLMVIGYVSDCRDLATLEHQTSTLEFAFLEQEVLNESRRVRELQADWKQFVARAQQLNKMLCLENPELWAKHQSVLQEIKLLQDPLGADKEEQDKIDPVKAEIDRQNAIAAEEEEQQNIAREMNPQSAKKCKVLYREIMQMIHPERTKDEQLHELIPGTQHYYNNTDLDGLRQLSKHIKKYLKSRKHPKWFRDNAAARKKKLQQTAQALIDQRKQLENILEGECVLLVDQGKRDEARLKVAAVLSNLIENNTLKLRALRNPSPSAARAGRFNFAATSLFQNNI